MKTLIAYLFIRRRTTLVSYNIPGTNLGPIACAQEKKGGAVAKLLVGVVAVHLATQKQKGVEFVLSTVIVRAISYACRVVCVWL